MKLSPKQQMFVVEYLVDLNATQAAIRAGYSAKTAEWVGPRMVTKSHVTKAIQVAMAEREQRTEITQDKVLGDLETVKRDAMQPKEDGKGMRNYSAALKALELMGKHLGLFKDKVELTGGLDRPITALTREELMRIACGGR